MRLWFGRRVLDLQCLLLTHHWQHDWQYMTYLLIPGCRYCRRCGVTRYDRVKP